MDAISTRAFLWEHKIVEQRELAARWKKSTRDTWTSAEVLAAADRIVAMLKAAPEGIPKREVVKRSGINRTGFVTALQYATYRWPIWEDNDLLGILP